MTIQMVYEINHTYMELSESEVIDKDDYRHKMLERNTIRNVLTPEIRMINNEKKLYVDVSGKESLLSRFGSRLADRQEVKALMESIYMIVENTSKYLIGEKDIVFRPELIFRNPVTKEYEFLIMPKRSARCTNLGMQELLQFIMAHLDNSDDKLVNAVYGMHEMYQSDSTGFGVAFEFFMNEIKEELEIEDTQEEAEEGYMENILLDVPRYIPGTKEIGALLMCLSGMILIGINIYYSMI